MPTSVGPDGIDVTGYGWTNQSTTFNSNKSLESYGSPNSALYNPAAQNGYVAWSMLPDDSISTTNHVASTHGQLTRIFVPSNATVGHADFYFTTTGTVTVFYAGVYTASGAQVSGLTTAESHASIVNTALTSLAFTSSAMLTGGQFYYVFTTMTWSVQPVLSGYTASAGGSGGNIAMANAGVAVATAPVTADYGVQATLPASLTMSGLTGLGTKIWVGLRA